MGPPLCMLHGNKSAAELQRNAAIFSTNLITWKLFFKELNGILPFNRLALVWTLFENIKGYQKPIEKVLKKYERPWLAFCKQGVQDPVSSLPGLFNIYTHNMGNGKWQTGAGTARSPARPPARSPALELRNANGKIVQHVQPGLSLGILWGVKTAFFFTFCFWWMENRT